MLFSGLHSINLDAKGRMAMPASVRRVIDDHCQGQLVVTIEPDGESLAIYPLNEFEEIGRKVAALPSFHPATKNLKRTFIGHATKVNLDSSGRILVPQNLREFIGLEKRVALVGQANKLELWNEDSWNEARKELLKYNYDAEDLPDELKNLSL